MIKRNIEMDQAIEFHKILDLKRGLLSPNETWPESLIIYYEKIQNEQN